MGAALVGMEVIRCRRVERGKVRRLGTQQGTQMKIKEPGRPGKESSVLSLCCFWFLCRRRPSCCRLSAGLCVPAGQLDAEDLWPVMFPVNKCLLACLCPVFYSVHRSPPCCPVRALSRSWFLCYR